MAFCQALQMAATQWFFTDAGFNSRHAGAALLDHPIDGQGVDSLPKWRAY